MKIFTKKKFNKLLAEHDAALDRAFYRGRDKGMAEVICFFKEKDKIYTRPVTIREVKKIEHAVFLDGFQFHNDAGGRVDLQKFYKRERDKDLNRWLRESE
jgi:hypothetical protein